MEVCILRPFAEPELCSEHNVILPALSKLCLMQHFDIQTDLAILQALLPTNAVDTGLFWTAEPVTAAKLRFLQVRVAACHWQTC